MFIDYSVTLPVNSKLLVVKFWGESKFICGLLTAQGVSALSPSVVQGPTVYLYVSPTGYICIKEIYYEELAHATMEAEKSHNL